MRPARVVLAFVRLASLVEGLFVGSLGGDGRLGLIERRLILDVLEEAKLVRLDLVEASASPGVVVGGIQLLGFIKKLPGRHTVRLCGRARVGWRRAGQSSRAYHQPCQSQNEDDPGEFQDGPSSLSPCVDLPPTPSFEGFPDGWWGSR
jgi:hypothetical protein